MTPLSSSPPFADGQSRGERWAVWLLIGLSLLFAIVPDTLSMNELGPEANHTITQGSMLRQVQYGSLFLGAAVMVWRHLSTAWRNLRAANLFLLLLVAYCLLSMAWSLYPSITIKRTVIFAGLVLIGLAVAPPISEPRQFLRVVMGTFTFILLVSFLVVIFVPRVGVDGFLGNAWRGITWQKNVMGAIAGVAALLWLREWLMNPRHRGLTFLGVMFCAFMMVMSKSATSILVTTLGAGLYMMTRHRLFGGRHAGQIVVLAALLALLYAVLLFFVMAGRMPGVGDIVGPVTALFNKSSDLTGRGEIWDMMEVAIDQRPLLGTGYGAFWTGEGGPAQFIIDKLGWVPAHGHNGYLDILLDMGEVGMALFIGCLLWHVTGIVKLFRIDREDAAMHLAILFIILVSNISETQILRDTSFQNILFIYSSLAISGRLASVRAQRRAAELAAQPPRPTAPRFVSQRRAGA